MGNALIRFNGQNYEDWYEQIHFQLGYYGFGLAIVSEKPISIIETSTRADNA